MPEIKNILLKKATGEELAAAEEIQLQQWSAISSYNREFINQLSDTALLSREAEIIKRIDEESIWGKVEGLIGISTRPVHGVHFLQTAWFRYAAAVLLLLGIGAYLLWRESGEPPAFGKNDKGSVVKSSPSSNNKAILTLADGSQIILDDKTSGNIAQQGNTQIIKLNNNQLTYNSKLKKTSPPAMEGTVFDPSEAGQKPGVAILYNTITTPRGSQYQIILPDGTKAWLNAASSIKFPTTFTGNQREITLTGEAYLEVKKDPKKTFIVKVNNQPDIIVIGTSFNINAYKEDASFKTSLLEGAVKVGAHLLSPGQAYTNGKIITTDLQQDIAWKNGIFNFNGLPLKEAMNQLVRWYDVEVIYEGEMPPFHFYGEIYRDLPLKDVLNVLSGMGVEFKVEGRKLIVKKQ